MAHLTFPDVTAAAERIDGLVHRTPVITSAAVDSRLGAAAFFKCENLQKTGAYKARGALNAVLQLSAEALSRGVLTHSSGNHGAALAWAARAAGARCTVVVPENANPMKVRAMESYGATLVPCHPARRAETAAAIEEQTSATFIHPYDDARVVAGQGTAVMELLDEVPDLDLIITPIGGGGLLSGSTVAAAAIAPHPRTVGAEPAGADEAHRSLQQGVRLEAVENPNTVADALLGRIGQIAFDVLTEHDVRIVTVTDEEIISAGMFHLQRMKLVIEPSSATALAALRKIDVSGRRVGVILSGGNTDLAWVR